MAFHMQDTFNVAAAGLLAQGKRALWDGRCSFRAPDGSRCAVGMLIPDSAYDPAFDSSWSGATLAMRWAMEAGHDVDLCVALMQVHDKVAVEHWAGGLAYVAKRFELNTDVLHGRDCTLPEMTAAVLEDYLRKHVPLVVASVKGHSPVGAFSYTIDSSWALTAKSKPTYSYFNTASLSEKTEKKRQELLAAYSAPKPKLYASMPTMPEPQLPAAAYEFKPDFVGLDKILKKANQQKAKAVAYTNFWS